jgi:flagella basal body P-ring formation protein FlgA
MRLLTLLNLVLLANGGPDTPILQPATSVTVVVRDTADVAGTEFTLGQIAEVTGADTALVAQVTAVKIGTSPLAGLSRTIVSGDILLKLRANRIDTRRVNVKCPTAVKVTRAGAEIPVEEMVQAAIAKVTDDRKALADGATVEAAPLAGRWFVQPGKREYKAVVSRGSVETGPVVVNVTTLVGGNPVKAVDVTVKIKRMVAALRVRRPLAPHAVLTAEDLTVGTTEYVPGAPAPIADLEAVLGKRTTRQLTLGDLLLETSVELAPALAAGQAVTLEIVVGGIHLQCPAVTRQAGAIGQTIRVYNSETRKETLATVVDGKTVRVEEN